MLEQGLVSLMVLDGIPACGIVWCGILRCGLLLMRQVNLGVNLLKLMCYAALARVVMIRVGARLARVVILVRLGLLQMMGILMMLLFCADAVVDVVVMLVLARFLVSVRMVEWMVLSAVGECADINSAWVVGMTL